MIPHHWFRVAVSYGICWILFDFALLLCGCEVLAESHEYRVNIGFNGIFRTGEWTAVEIDLPTDASHETTYVWSEDADGQLVRSPACTISKKPDGSSSARTSIRFGRRNGRLFLEREKAFSSQSNTAASHRTLLECGNALPSSQRILLVLGELPSMDRAVRLMADADGRRPTVVSVQNPDSLPITSRDFDSVDDVIVCGTWINSLLSSGFPKETVEAVPPSDDAAERFDDRFLSVLAALDGWVRRGGNAVFILGKSAERVANSKAPLADWIPGKIDRMIALRRFGAIETFAHSSKPLEKGRGLSIDVPVLRAIDGRGLSGAIESYEGLVPGDLPLVVRTAHGLGVITWIGFDLDQSPFSSWQGTDTLLTELLHADDSQNDMFATSSEKGTLETQLHTALDQFPGVSLVPFEFLALLFVLYVASLFPLDWWLVSKGFARPWVAWISLPAIVFIFSAVAIVLADRWKGSSWQFIQADLVDVDASSGLVRGTSLVGVWSPINTTFDLDATPTNILPPLVQVDTALSWFAKAGQGIGGTDAAAAHLALSHADYVYSNTLGRLQSIPIAASSSRLFEIEWTANVADTWIESSLDRDAQGTIRGTLRSHLPFPLEDCLLVHGGWLYDVGLLVSEGTFDPYQGRGPRSLASVLTQRSSSQDRDRTVRWSTADRDIDRVLQVAGFHNAAGGKAYTTLDAGRLDRLDFSSLLTINRAVLVGHGPRGTAWHSTPPDAARESTSHCVWRIVFPVRSSLSNPTSEKMTPQEPDREYQQ